MEMWGADVEQLDTLARDLTAAAASLESIGRSVSGRMGSVPGAGRDATTFRDEWVQLGANVVTVGAGAATMLGFLPAAPVAVAAAGVSEVSGLVSVTGHWIDDPNDPEVAEQVVLQATTGGLVGPKGAGAAEATFDGAKGLITDVLTKVD